MGEGKLERLEGALVRIHNIVGNSKAYAAQRETPPDTELLRNRREVLDLIEEISGDALGPLVTEWDNRELW
jgi:hypothetical protein